MPDHAWSVFCYKGCIDRLTNQASLLDVIEAMTLAPSQEMISSPLGSTAFRARCDLVTLWTRSDLETPERFRTRVRLVATTGDSLLVGEEIIDVDLGTQERHRTVLKMDALPYWGGGVYRFVVELEG